MKMPDSLKPLARYKIVSEFIRSRGVIDPIRPVWLDCFGAFRIGRTDDMNQMFDDLEISNRSF